MRIRVIHKPAQSCIDGVQLDHFAKGRVYDVGVRMGSLFLAEGWGEPVDADEPAEVIPLREFLAPVRRDPPNLVREIFPSYYDTPAALAADRRRTTRRRS